MMRFLNLNTAQTVISAILYAIPLVLVKFGCTTINPGLPNEALDCSSSQLITPMMAVWMGSILAFLKFIVIPALQPGGLFRNLFDSKVPIAPTPDKQITGTVVPADVKK